MNGKPQHLADRAIRQLPQAFALHPFDRIEQGAVGPQAKHGLAGEGYEIRVVSSIHQHMMRPPGPGAMPWKPQYRMGNKRPGCIGYEATERRRDQ